jgi:ATP:ADP antiporter, AAA family
VNQGLGPAGECEPVKEQLWEQRMSATRPSRRMVVLRAFATVHDDETNPVFWACALVSSLLAGNYLVRPVRDEMGIAGGTAYLPTLFAGTLVAMLVVGPLLSSRLNRRPGRPNFSRVFRFFQLTLIAFFFVFQWISPPGQAWTARAFFVWASVANLLIVSIAWGALAWRFSCEQAHRLFGLVAAGGTLGAIVGSSLASVLAVSLGPTWLLLLAVVFWEAGVLAARRLFEPSIDLDLGSNRSVDVDTVHDARRLSRKVYLVGLGLWTLLFTTSSALIYLEQARIVGASISDPASQTAFFARIDLLVNLTGLTMQVFATGWVLSVLGAGGSAAILPVVTLAGSIILALWPTVATIMWFQVARRSVDYAIARPSREVFYTVVDRAELSRAKLLIDTAVYRAGDAAGAWTYGIFTALPGLSTAPLAIVPLSLFWIVLSLILGRALLQTEKAADNRAVRLNKSETRAQK